MTERERKDAELERDVVRALRTGGELIPVSDEEVLAAEEELAGTDLELPDGLREYRGRPRRPARPGVRGPWLGYGVAGLLGAAASTLLWLGLAPEKPHDLSGAGRDLVRPSASAPAPRPTLINGSSCSNDCCAGKECRAATGELKECASGHTCVACAGRDDGPYRLRLGAMVLTEAGEALLQPTSGAPLELCVSTPGATPTCLPALSSGTADDQWRLLDRVSSSQDLLSGLSVEVRRKGEPSALASWKYPVTVAPEVFCKGLAIPLRQEKDVVGRVSAFVDQTHFVELGRAPTLAALRERRALFEFHGIEPRVYETTEASRRFALVLGPFDKAQAQALRWAALEGDKEAAIVFGLDFKGAPQPLR
ncbi:MAG TPA: hypothetical protein VM686_08665 [Polyangiaceae bacterium]|nr:hypothetical protein [Polyangiaceae bacterium]